MADLIEIFKSLITLICELWEMNMIFKILIIGAFIKIAMPILKKVSKVSI